MKVGIVGCGAISDRYFEAGKVFDVLRTSACADIVEERAREKAAKHGCRACTVNELLADPEIEVVINLTIPLAHAEVSLKALEAGKHVYSEKPLAVTRDDGAKILRIARKKNLRVGCAPDTFLGAGIQTCIKLINDGAIGQPVAAAGFMLRQLLNKPIPDHLFKPGGGPMFDVGVYYVTALAALLGPVRRVAGSTCTPRPQRLATPPSPQGRLVDVEMPTTVAGTLEFSSGAVGVILASFDALPHALAAIEVYGSEGTLGVPDPNTFGGPVRLARTGSKAAVEIPLTHGNAEESRGLGAADMICGIGSGREHRANGGMAYHVLDIMHAFHDSARTGRHVEVKSTCEKPKPLPAGLKRGKLD